MKYPLLKTRSLPNLYKHCATVLTLHIDIKNNGMDEEEAFLTSYFEYVRNQMYACIEANFVTSLASRIYAQSETFVIFKSNTTEQMVVDTLFALFAELDTYGDQHITMSYQYLQAMLFQEDVPVKFYKANKVGDDIQDSKEYEKATITYQHDKKSRGKQLCSIDEYRRIYAHSLQHQKKVPLKQEEPKNIDTFAKKEDVCEYYI